MANGVTWGVKDGSIASFNDFLRTAAEYYGLPDSSIAVDEAFSPSEKSLQRLSEAKRTLDKVRQWSEEEATRKARAYFEKQYQSYKEDCAYHATLEGRYNRMIAQTHAWQPPTEEHNDFKQYMLKQLRDAMAHDVHIPTEPHLMTGPAFKEMQVELCEVAVANACRTLESERQRHETRVKLANYWNALREALDSH